MRREVLQAAVARIVADVKGSGMWDMLEQAVDRYRHASSNDVKQSDWLSLSILTKYFAITSDYSEVEWQIMKIMGLEGLADPDVWEDNYLEASPQFIFKNHSVLRNSLEFLPKVTSLLKRNYESDKPSGDSSNKDVEIQKIILTDEGESLSTPTRIVELLQSIEQVYSVLAEVNCIKDAKIAVVGLDSGSEKSFDFLGVAKLMHELRETLKEVYNMVSFHKQNVTLKNLQVAGESIGIVAEITKLEKSGGIATEDANRMKHSLYCALEKFAGTGAYTPEMGQQVQAPLIAMRPQPRLLTGPVEEIVRDANEADECLDDQAPDNSLEGEFTEEELKRAAQLLRKTKSESASKTDSKRSTSGLRRTKAPK